MDDNKKFERLALRVKLKRWLMTILLIVILVPVMAGIGYKFTQNLSSTQTEKLMTQFTIRQEVMAPNIQSSDLYISNSGLGGGEVSSHEYKDIDGYHIPWGSANGTYNWLYSEINNDNLVDMTRTAAYNRVTQEKIPMFYNNQVTNPAIKKANELAAVSSMHNYVAEVAVSFDQPMTYQQILAKLPKNIRANWFWIGVGGQADPTLQDNNLMGIRSVSGKITDLSYHSFWKNLKAAKKGNLGQFNQFSLSRYATQYAKKYPFLKQAKFSGVILTGKSESFKALRNRSWISESSAGATIKRVPYIEPKY